MKLKNSLYTISTVAYRELMPTYDLRLHVDHPIYQAHFPGEPITPGVCIIQIAQELLEDHLRRPLLLQAVKNVKFLSVISPVETPAVTYRFDKIAEADATVRAQVAVLSGDTELARLSFTCR